MIYKMEYLNKTFLPKQISKIILDYLESYTCNECNKNIFYNC